MLSPPSPRRHRRRPATLHLRALGWIAAAALALGLASGAGAQSVVDIRAVVNDDAISAYDVNQRLNLIIRSSSLPDTEAARRQLAPRILDSLVDEALQMQEAKRLGVKVEKAEIDKALALLEKQNNLPAGGLDEFLKERGIDKRTLVRQVEASLAWSEVARRQLMRTITITDEEVDAALARIKENAGKPRLLVAEIFIAVDSPNDEAAARRNAERIFQELRRGASFPLLARQFSQSASAERGGDLGWVQPGELDPEVEKVLAAMQPNTVSDPVRTANGFSIVALRDRREPAAKGVGDTTVSLRQILLPAGTQPAEQKSQRDLAGTLRNTVQGCTDFTKAAKELGAGSSGDLGRLKMSELPEDLRRVVADLEVGKPSEPLVDGGNLRLLMVCERKTPEIKLPSREEVRRRLTIQRIEIRARRYLRDLRDAAFLDIRT